MKIIIDGKDYSRYLTLPVTVQKTLNEQLDTGMLTLAFMPVKAPFKPFLPVTFEEDGVSSNFLIAADDVKEVFGRKRYHHTITLIEETKSTERILCEAKAFTQPLVRDYADGSTIAEYKQYEEKLTTDGYVYKLTGEGGLYDGRMFSPIKYSGTLEIPLNGRMTSQYGWLVLGLVPISTAPTEPGRIIVAYAETYGAEEEILYSRNATEIDLSSSVFVDVPYKAGCYIVRIVSSPRVATPYLGGTYYDVPIEVWEGVRGRNPYTVGDVIDTILTVAEPLREGLDTPRFTVRYTEKQKKTIRDMEAPPQLLFSNGRSLWENLREIGRIVHAIPRRSGSEIVFDELGGSKYADLSGGKRFHYSDSFNAADYTAAIEANVNNLINSEDVSEGSVTEPFAGGYQSLRTAYESVRIKDETGIIHTMFPIEKVVSLKFRYQTNTGTVLKGVITPYVFEKAEYDLLSSYSGGYPSSKTYAIYYTQGTSDIQGLWFRADDSGSGIVDALFRRPSIINIISAVSGVGATDISDNYPEMCFEVTYLTTVSARVRQHKAYFEGKDEFVMAYNQSANRLSSRAFGEAMRGQVAMMGTTSTRVMYLFRKFSDIPTPGLLFDDENYISSVTTQIYRDHCVSQIDLSTGYNEFGAYAEMNTAIRQYEIPGSEERFTVIEEFCDIGGEGSDDPNVAAGYQFRLAMIRMLQGDSSRAFFPITLASVSTYDEAGATIAKQILLPVVSYSIGNALYFGFRFSDNYSAGQSSEDAPTSTAKYRLPKDAPYGDPYYSVADKLNFSLYARASMSDDSIPDAAHSLPEMSEGITLGTEMVTLGDYPLIWKKDSADAGNVSYQLHFISDRGYIIGSGMARSCPFIRSETEAVAAKFYFFDHRINQLTGTADISDAIAESEFILLGNAPMKIQITSVPSVSFKSWACIRGNEFLFGKNASEIDSMIYFKFKRKR